MLSFLASGLYDICPRDYTDQSAVVIDYRKPLNPPFKQYFGGLSNVCFLQYCNGWLGQDISDFFSMSMASKGLGLAAF